MGQSVKRVVCWLLLIWLVGMVLSCVIVPLFQKDPPSVKHRPSPAAGSARERVRCIDDNQEALIRRLQLIESAEEEIVLSTYYLGRDDSGQDIMAALLQAADRGVRLRLLVDGFCAFTGLRSSSAFQALTAAPGVEVKIYNPVNLLSPWKTNYRMHDKYLIIDGSTYLLGGRNTRNVSLGRYSDKYDIDRDVLVVREGEGGSVEQVLSYFEQVWENPYSKPVKPRENQKGRALLEKRYETLEEAYPEVFSHPDFTSLTTPVNSITLMTNPTNAGGKVPALWSQLVSCMEQGREIVIQTPYLICNRQMYRDLRSLKTQDREMKIITNAPESGANPWGSADLMNSRKRILGTGVTLCEYAEGHSSHIKTILIDDRYSLVGTFNFDMRSAYLDTEMMLLIDSSEVNAQLRQVNEHYLSRSRCHTPEGDYQEGANYIAPKMGLIKGALYTVLRIAILPIRHLL